jgi:catechol 2,3-dioxygenase-like lactoylglutathione lyase family enzyme
MEARKNITITPSIRDKEIQKSLDFYTKILSFQTTEPYTLEGEQTMEEEHQEDVWKEERKAVDDIAKTLRFDSIDV